MRRFLFRLVNVFRRDRADEEVTREINAHLALLEDDYRRRGMTADEARLAARRALGGVAHAKDVHRDARTFVWLDDAWRDLAHGVRMLRRTRGFTAVAVITLALGIGANTAIFSVLSAVLLRPLPYPNADRLVQIFTPAVERPGGRPMSRGGALASAASISNRCAAGSRTLSHVGGYIIASSTLTGQGDAVRLNGIQMTASMFPVLAVAPMLGRPFDEREENGGSDAVVVLSAAAWQRFFDSDSDVVGRVIALDGRGRTVVGVMPREFAFPDTTVQYWVPYVRPAANAKATFSLATIGRLREGVGLQAAEDEINGIMRAADGRAGRFEVADAARRAGRIGTASVAHARGRRGSRTADCLRERGEPAACAQRSARSRDRDSACRRRVAGAVDPTAAHRKRAARVDRRGRRHRSGVRRDQSAADAGREPAAARPR